MNGFRFVADKGRFHGIPARDLTQAEFEALTPNLQRLVLTSDAYTARGGTPPKVARSTTKAADTGNAESTGKEETT